ncbi:hypothetical protein [Chitinophaga cymbidii]|nr:hypothetical protein [Chitinophaga cymbidii]
MSQAMWFATRVWFTAVGVAPLLAVSLNYFYEQTGISDGPTSMISAGWVLIFPMFFVGFLFSLPSWFLLCLATHFLIMRGAEGKMLRRWLLPVASVLTLLPFGIIMAFSDWSLMDTFVMIAVVSYWVVICFGIMYYDPEGRAESWKEENGK